ncbi:MAG: phosphatidylserine/phosphatidylglycerophosphate/cardiolipin synthase family protein [Erythrobacter sp.]
MDKIDPTDSFAPLDEKQAEYREPEPFVVDAAGHRFAFHPAGIDRFATLLGLIESAQTSLKLFYYMFQDDFAGQQVRSALVQAAERGVEVDLIVDAFGTDAPNSFFDPLKEAGGNFAIFEPRMSARYLIRNHQKMAIADDERVMAGGFNISDNYFKPPEENGWADLGVLIEGPIVERFGAWFVQMKSWVSKPGTQYRLLRQMLLHWDRGDGATQLLMGGPTQVTSAWARQVKRDMANAQRLDMVMAYFSPPRSIRRLIRRIAERGTTRLIMAGKSDNNATIGASRALYRGLLHSEVTIAEFQPSKLHCKLIVVDDVTYFGSANFDLRSIRLNLELMVRVEDKELAERMRELIGYMDDASEPITAEWYKRRANWFNRIRWRLGWFLVSVVDYTVTRRINLGL